MAGGVRRGTVTPMSGGHYKMRITPLDVRKQEFRKAMRGLDGEEVYAFLATVADEYEAVLNDNKALRERLLELDDKVQEYRSMERALRDTLLTAERVTVETKDNARREGILIVKEAQIEADKALRDIRTESMTLRQQVAQLRSQRDGFLAKMKVVTESHLDFIESARDDFVGDDAIHNEPIRPKTEWTRPDAGSDSDLFDDAPDTAVEDVRSATDAYRTDAPPLTAQSDVATVPMETVKPPVPKAPTEPHSVLSDAARPVAPPVTPSLASTAPASTPVPTPVVPYAPKTGAPEVSAPHPPPGAVNLSTAPQGESVAPSGSTPTTLSDSTEDTIAGINEVIERMRQGQSESVKADDHSNVSIPPQSIQSTTREAFAPLPDTATATLEPAIHKPPPPQGVPVGGTWNAPEKPLESEPPVPGETDVTGEWDIEKIRQDLARNGNPDTGG